MRSPSARWAFLLCLAGCLSSATQAADTPAKLEAAVVARASRIEELVFAVEEATKLGVRLWLQGGGAASLLHFERDARSGKFDPNRFPDRFEAIFRSDQDIDLLIDGDATKAKKLQSLLQERFPLSIGHRDVWGVETLTISEEGKVRIGKLEDVTGQHTDTYSLGVFELTKPPSGERRFRDLDRWVAKNSRFFDDAFHGRIQFLYSSRHGTTMRARQGRNPPIISVLRLLEKVFRYNLDVPQESQTDLQDLAAWFNVESDVPSHGYVRHWIQWHGMRMLRHAQKLPQALQWLDKFHLRTKLRTIGDSSNADDLAYWVTREPLPFKKVGEGSGLTAKQLRLSEIAHETEDLVSYESLFGARDGSLNAFTSRHGVPNENAVHGNGFYARVGKFGPSDRGYVVRLLLAPEAREGTDFLRAAEDYVVILNAAAVTVIAEPWSLDLKTWLTRFGQEHQPAETDRGVFELLLRRLASRAPVLTVGELDALDKAVVHELSLSHPSARLIQQYFRTQRGKSNRDVLRKLALHPDGARLVALAVMPNPEQERTLRELARGDEGIRRVVKLAAVARDKTRHQEIAPIIAAMEERKALVRSPQDFLFLVHCPPNASQEIYEEIDGLAASWISMMFAGSQPPTSATIQRAKRQFESIGTHIALTRELLRRAKTAEDFVEALDPQAPYLTQAYWNALSEMVTEFKEPIAASSPSPKQLRRIHGWSQPDAWKNLLAHLVGKTKNGRQFFASIEALAPSKPEARQAFLAEALLRHAKAMGEMRVDDALLLAMRSHFTSFFQARPWLEVFAGRVSSEKLPELLGVTATEVAANAKAFFGFLVSHPSVLRQLSSDHPLLLATLETKDLDRTSVLKFVAERLDRAESAMQFLEEWPLCWRACRNFTQHLDAPLRERLQTFASFNPEPAEVQTLFSYFSETETLQAALQIFLPADPDLETLRAILVPPLHLSQHEAVTMVATTLGRRWPQSQGPLKKPAVRDLLRRWMVEAKRRLGRNFNLVPLVESLAAGAASADEFLWWIQFPAEPDPRDLPMREATMAMLRRLEPIWLGLEPNSAEQRRWEALNKEQAELTCARRMTAAATRRDATANDDDWDEEEDV